MRKNEGVEIGVVRYYDPKEKFGIITPDNQEKKDVTIIDSPISLKVGDEVKFIANKEGMVTYIQSGSDELFQVLNEFNINLDDVGVEYKEIEKKYGEIIDKTLQYENKNILRTARNLTQSLGDEENYELVDFLIKFIKATLPEAFKNIITITNFDRENIRKQIPNEIYDKFVDSPKIQQIIDIFIKIMLKKFDKTYDTYLYPQKEGIENGGLTKHAFQEIGSFIRMTLNCYMNHIDPAILEQTPEEKMKGANKMIEHFEKNKKRPAIVIKNPEELNEALNKITRNEKDKRDYLNNKN